MSDWGYLPNEYEIAIGEISHRKRLIVEGPTDKNVFKTLLCQFDEYENELSTQNKINEDNIDIDCVEDLPQNDFNLNGCTINQNGNRGKVEYLHETLQNSPKHNNLVFFADREFREFNLDKIQDYLNGHKVKGSLVWSRGHSIENYLFDFNILRQSLRGLTKDQLYDKNIQNYEKLFYNTIRFATAISLALKDCEKIQALEDKFNWDLIDVDDSEVILNVEECKIRLKNQQGSAKNRISLEDVETVIASFQNWYIKLKKNAIEINTIRWICHGHIGAKIIIEVYRACIKYTYYKNHDFKEKPNNTEVKNQIEEDLKKRKRDIEKEMKNENPIIFKQKNKDMWKILINYWASKVVSDKNNKYPYPKEIIDKLRDKLR